MLVTHSEIHEAICSLENNKATGMDNISAEHLKNCSSRLTVLLSLCFTGLFIHGFMPQNLMSVLLIPIVKNKNSKISSKANYRPIALASVMSKVVENVILNRVFFLLDTECNQFGFKSRMGTDMPIHLLKEIIDKYRRLNGNIFYVLSRCLQSI